MDVIERLKRDHTILRSKLDVLESALRMGPQMWYVLHEVCYTLACQLQDHLKREEALVIACRKAMDPEVLAGVAVEHRDEPEHLRTITRLFVSQSGHSLELIGPALTKVIQGLRRHMAEEETELFPVFEQGLAAQQCLAAQAAKSGSHVQEAMTVNHVVHAFPATKRVFERLFINVSVEGCACLDEVAWRHGMGCRQLLNALEAALPPAEEETTRRPVQSTTTIAPAEMVEAAG